VSCDQHGSTGRLLADCRYKRQPGDVKEETSGIELLHKAHCVHHSCSHDKPSLRLFALGPLSSIYSSSITSYIRQLLFEQA